MKYQTHIYQYGDANNITYKNKISIRSLSYFINHKTPRKFPYKKDSWKTKALLYSLKCYAVWNFCSSEKKTE